MTTKALILGTGLLALTLSACSTPGPYRTRDQLVSNPVACGERRFEVYFDNDRDALTTAAVQAIQLHADQLRSCQIDRVQVTGLADARGGASVRNQTLSARRAQAVADALAVAGLPAPAFEVSAAGADGASQGGVNDPLRRRTEVVIHARTPH